MKKWVVVMLMMMGFRAGAQTFEIEQLILDWQKLAQLKNILNDLYKGYEILSSGYNSIKDISQGNFNLHKAFLDGLLVVSPAVKQYRHVADIINDQSRLVSEYKSALNRFKQDKHFTPNEIVYLAQVYGNLFNESLKDIDNLINVITDSKLRMNDDERLHAIDQIYTGSRDKLMFLRQFNNNTMILSMQRAVDENDMNTTRRLYGLE
ncbi:MAG TPA: hypothetical protein VK543_12420 [Puia sp.]|nr:hypothetical protein [Puia sp.]